MKRRINNVICGVVLSCAVLFAFAQERKEASPFDYSALTYLWVVAWAALGGFVNFMRKIRAGAVRSFNLTELAGEIITSAFVGLLTFWMCKATGIGELTSAILIGVSGHMGSRAIFGFEKWAESKFPVIDKS